MAAGLSRAQRELLEAMAADQRNCVLHRSMGILQDAHVSIGGVAVKRSARTFDALLARGYVGHQAWIIGNSGAVRCWTTPEGRQAIGMELSAAELAVVAGRSA